MLITVNCAHLKTGCASTGGASSQLVLLQACQRDGWAPLPRRETEAPLEGDAAGMERSHELGELSFPRKLYHKVMPVSDSCYSHFTDEKKASPGM